MSQFISLSTGVTVPYVERGRRGGVPVILLHGYSDSLRSYDLLLAALPETVHAFAFTQRGHGDASRPAEGYAPADYAADLAAFMDAVGVPAAIVVGHSGGSYVAQRFAIDHPERTLGVVLVGAFPSFADNEAVVGLLEEVRGFGDQVDPAFVREFQESCIAQFVPAVFVDAIVADSQKMPARVWKAYLEAFVADEPPTRTGTISAPTLVLWGDQDAFCPREQQDALVAAIAGAELSVYRGTGHCPHWEQPGRVATELVAFAALPALS